MTALGTRAAWGAGRTAARLGAATSALLVVTAGLNVLYLIGLVASQGQTSPLVNVGLSLATQWVPAAIFWLVAVRTRFRRAPVVLAAAGITASAIGDSYYSLAMDADGYLASPSWADPAYLLFYPLLVAALVALVRGQLRGVGRLVLLETAVGTVGASAVLAVLLDPVIRESLGGDDPLAGAVAISYPLFDLVLLAVIAGVAAAPTIRLGRRWWALIAGLLVTAIGDVAYALLGTIGTYLAGTPLDATWAVGVALVAWWGAGMADPDPVAPASGARRLSIPVPAIAVLTGLALLVAATLVPVSTLAVVLAALTVGLGAVPIIFRPAMLGRMLADREEALRRLTALDRAKTDIMATMNHEFRTPLTSIMGHVELLVDGGAGELPAAATGMLQTIERNGERLQRLLDETLTASRLEDGSDALARVPVGLRAIVERVAESVAPAAERRGVEVAVDHGRDDLRDVIEGDPAHLELALGGILDNAVKFSEAGGRVAVTLHSTRDRVEVIVRDDGIGIPRDDLASVFTRYFRAANVQRAAIPGVGLGLSIAHHVIRAHDGSITLESEPGRGTSVTVRLPLARSGRRHRARATRATRARAAGRA